MVCSAGFRLALRQFLLWTPLSVLVGIAMCTQGLLHYQTLEECNIQKKKVIESLLAKGFAFSETLDLAS